MERKKRKRFAFGELIEEGRLHSHDSRPKSGIYLDLVTYSSIPKRIGGRSDLPDDTSEFDSSTSRIPKVFGFSLAFLGVLGVYYRRVFYRHCRFRRLVHMSLSEGKVN